MRVSGMGLGVRVEDMGFCLGILALALFEQNHRRRKWHLDRGLRAGKGVTAEEVRDGGSKG